MPESKRKSARTPNVVAAQAANALRCAPEFALTIFIGAFLLFQVQPLIGKYILPWFGGGPGVWTTCMLFFQVCLLAGYAYAHFISRFFRPRTQIIAHLALLLFSLLFLPVIPAERWKPGANGNPIAQILLLLIANLGLPYVALASTSPLMQHWFSRTHAANSPYRFYSLSNVGSLLALISYPFFFETHFTRKTQGILWSGGLIAFALCTGVCALKVWKHSTSEKRKAESEKAETFPHSAFPHSAFPPAWSLWLVLPACASMLLLATTNKLCLDIAVAPFLWIIPLASYLLSFVICFDHPRWYRRLPWGIAASVALAGFCYAPRQQDWPGWKLIAVYSTTFFILCMICHGELYRLRPEPRNLTAFYLMIALGGALGGIFVAVVAPIIFIGYHELQLGVLCCALLFLAACLRDSWHAQRLACIFLTIGVIALGAALWQQREKFGDQLIRASRNFYGVLRVFDHGEGDPPEHILWVSHGQTLHGAQFRSPEKASLPTIYYGENSGVGLAMNALPPGNRRIGLVGLGAGTLATYSRPGDYFHIYEINPEMLRIARSNFQFLSASQAALEFTLGDGRLSLERQPPQQFDLLVLDAFSSDAIPVHLLTAEAFDIYRRHVKTNGVIAVHISNKWLNLEPVLANVSRHFQYRMAVVDHIPAPQEWWLRRSIWVLLTREGNVLDTPAIRQASRMTEDNLTAIPLWTDDFTSLFPILE